MLRLLIIFISATSLSADPMDYVKVIDAVYGELNQDGGRDNLVLVENSEGMSADLYLYLSNEGTVLPLVFPNVAWLGGMWGQIPSLSFTPSLDSFQIKSEQWGCCRNKWDTIMTVSYRNNEFVVSGWTHKGIDTLGQNENSEDPFSFGCDVNLLTGGYETYTNDEIKKGKTQAQNLRLIDYDMDKIPQICTAFFDSLPVGG